MLIIFGGRTGTGKTTLSRALARHLEAVHLRIDTIERALRGWSGTPAGEAGYHVGYAVAEDNLRLGRTVIADCVNPLHITRMAWQAVADRAGVRWNEVEIVCSDADEHRRRLEAREKDSASLERLTWADVLGRDYEPWVGERIIIDTAGRSTAECLVELIQASRTVTR